MANAITHFLPLRQGGVPRRGEGWIKRKTDYSDYSEYSDNSDNSDNSENNYNQLCQNRRQYMCVTIAGRNLSAGWASALLVADGTP